MHFKEQSEKVQPPPSANLTAPRLPDSSAPAVSVVIPSYYSAGWIRGVLAALAAQETSLSYEMIVVDSASDQTAQIVRDEFPAVRIIHSECRLQVGAARNTGVDAALGKVILFIDTDTIPCPTWLDQMARAILEQGADAVGGGMVNGTPWSLSGSAGFYLEFFRFLAWRGKPRSAAFLVGGNCGFRRELVTGFRFLESSLGEDMIFSHALARQGRKVLFLPSASVIHRNRTGFATVFDYQRKIGRAAADYRSVTSPGWIGVLRAFPPLTWIAPPAVMAWIAWTLLCRSRVDLLRFLFALPACYFGSMAWAMGFYQRLRTSK